MIRLKISNFIKKHKDKIKILWRKLIIVAVVVLAATIILSSLSNTENQNKYNDKGNVYKPTQTIIEGSDVSKEQYEKDSNLIDKFLKYCNDKQVEEAYNLISDECKKEAYPTIDRFKENYYNYIFNKKRECNLQAWISTSKYTVYKVRYTNDMMSTGTYDESDVYQDYLTLNKKNETEKISIGSFIDSEELNITTTTKGIEATVVKKKIYLEEEKYEIYVKNNTEKAILLDNLQTNKTIWLIADGIQYRPYINKLYFSDLIIEPGEKNKITIQIMKSFNSEKTSDYIQFTKVIKDYNVYIEDTELYGDFVEIRIKVED